MTKTIAGRKMELVAGVRYRASRPFASRGRKEYPVSIAELLPNGEAVPVLYRFDGLTYEQANALVNEFNNGPMSFDGRVW